ncbi:MAG: site-2 protease family protein [Firmicutes bacterium]|nr:site-2 protease family protein [Bacillota bacterium]
MLFSLTWSDFTFWELLSIIGTYGLAIMLALVLHEWAHAWAAYKSGDPTAKMLGRMTLNPAKHVEPLGLLSFIFVGIGWAKPVPVNPFNYRNFKRGNFFVSIAGVTVNFIIGFIASLGFFLFAHFDLYTMNVGFLAIYYFFLFSMSINIMLMIFNLLPIAPLDGYNMLRSFTKPGNAYMKFARENAMILLLVVLLVSMFSGGIFHLHNLILRMFMGLWGVFF